MRAAETHSLGMIGIGEIFAMFRDGVLNGDDEVALVYDPQTYRNLSDSLVNLRAALKAAVAEQVIDEAAMNCLLAQMKSCYFPYRSYRALELLCPALGGFFQRAALPDLKAKDARELLLTVGNMRRLAPR